MLIFFPAVVQASFSRLSYTYLPSNGSYNLLCGDSDGDVLNCIAHRRRYLSTCPACGDPDVESTHRADVTYYANILLARSTWIRVQFLFSLVLLTSDGGVLLFCFSIQQILSRCVQSDPIPVAWYDRMAFAALGIPNTRPCFKVRWGDLPE